MGESSVVRSEAAAVFAAVRAGDASQVGALVKFGDEVIPALAPLLDDADPTVRREALAVLAALDSVAAARIAAKGVADADPDIAMRAARFVLRSAMRHGFGQFPDLGSAAAAKASPDAATLLLAAFSPRAEPMLRAALGEDRLVKLVDSGPAVKAALPAEIALARRGDSDARLRLIAKIEAGDAADLEFLLAVIAMIDAPELLHALAGRTLANDQGVGNGLPSGVTPRRRIRDLALEAFSSRLGLKTKVTTSPSKRYSPEEFEQVRRAMSTSLPR